MHQKQLLDPRCVHYCQHYCRRHMYLHYRHHHHHPNHNLYRFQHPLQRSQTFPWCPSQPSRCFLHPKRCNYCRCCCRCSCQCRRQHGGFRYWAPSRRTLEAARGRGMPDRATLANPTGGTAEART
ncbi:unnamed protein product [Ectocarpus sp. 12 AP-2014]